MKNKRTVAASIVVVVLAMLFVASAFFSISQRLAFATSSNSDGDEEDKCIDAANKISNDADGHASSNVCEISLARGSPTITLLS